MPFHQARREMRYRGAKSVILVTDFARRWRISFQERLQGWKVNNRF